MSRRPEDDDSPESNLRELRLYLIIIVIGIVIYLALRGHLSQL